MLAFLFSSDLFGACTMPTQAWSLLSPCIAVRSDHFEVATTVDLATDVVIEGVPHTIVWGGLYSGGNRQRLRLPLTSQNHASLRGSCPQGITIPNGNLNSMQKIS